MNENEILKIVIKQYRKLVEKLFEELKGEKYGKEIKTESIQN